MKAKRDDPLDASLAKEIRHYLGGLLVSPCMGRSKSLPSFLRYIVDETLAGRAEDLKSHSIGVEALGRAEDFDANNDPIVRIQAGRLRRALDAYYADEGRNDTVRIELPKGGYRPKFRRVEHETTNERSPHTLGVGPALAVIPVVRLDGNDDEGFASTLTHELLAALSSLHELAILTAPPLPDSYADPHASAKAARRQGARFVLAVAYQRSDATIVVRAQLVDVLSGTVVWTDKLKYDRAEADLFELEEELSQRIARKIAGNYGVIPRLLTDESHAKPIDELTVYDAILRFRQYQQGTGKEEREQAIEALERAIELAPRYALCWAMLAEAISDGYGLRIDCRPELLPRAVELARRAVAIDPNCQHAYWALTLAHLHLRDRDGLLNSAEKTIALNPNNNYLVGVAAWAMALAGEWERGLPILHRVMSETPQLPTWLHLAPYLGRLRHDDFEAALEHANRFNTPALPWDPILRAAALGYLGRERDATPSLLELAERFPDANKDPAHYMRGYMFLEEMLEMMLEGLRKAGWREGTAASNQ